jgi:hypothetical protein
MQCTWRLSLPYVLVPSTALSKLGLVTFEKALCGSQWHANAFLSGDLKARLSRLRRSLEHRQTRDGLPGLHPLSEAHTRPHNGLHTTLRKTK